MTIHRAQGRAGYLQPLAGGPDGVAASLALALEHPCGLLPGRSCLAAGVEPCVGQGACRGEDWRDRGKEGLAWRRGEQRRVRGAALPFPSYRTNVAGSAGTSWAGLPAPRERSLPARDETPQAAWSEHSGDRARSVGRAYMAGQESSKASSNRLGRQFTKSLPQKAVVILTSGLFDIAQHNDYIAVIEHDDVVASMHRSIFTPLNKPGFVVK